ncbi:valine--tRNA ligase, chloroplastic/mitochondrial 2 [Gossypium raimondii]|nr:valine--tRNA ligase, chloroplastic/mitochondrial 2 [Gossypium raimondii]
MSILGTKASCISFKDSTSVVIFVLYVVFISATHAWDLCFFLHGYIEASKARIYHSGDDSVALVAQTVLLYVFENILKLLHLFMPFVTEELWQALPNRREALIISSWPQTSLPRSTDLVKIFENFQALTRAIQNARAEYSVEPAKLITASIVGSEEVIQYISEEKEVLALLSKLDLDNIHFNDEVVLGFSSLLANINFNLLILAACYLIRLLVMLA